MLTPDGALRNEWKKESRNVENAGLKEREV